MELTKIENSTPVKNFPQIYNDNIDQLISEINGLRSTIQQRDGEIARLREDLTLTLNKMRSEYLTLIDKLKEEIEEIKENKQ